VNIENIRDRLGQLSDKGRELIGSRYTSEVSNQEFVDANAFREWRVGCEFNCDSPYLSAVARGQAVLRAAREYIDFGPVARVEELVAAEIFSDLLGMASRELREGRAAAGAIVGAAVLEDVMRRCARHRKVAIRENVDTLAELNAKLAAGEIYPAAMRDKIAAWADLRTKAETGALSEDSRAEVERVLRGVRDFVNDHLF
jgi:hypothetical protein